MEQGKNKPFPFHACYLMNEVSIALRTDGPASVNYELTEAGKSIVSCDPVYQFSAEEIAGRIKETTPVITEKLEDSKDSFVWSEFSNVQNLVDSRLTSMNAFLKDYEEGKIEGRYVHALLPDLPFKDNSFDLVLVSHLLFLYTDHQNTEFFIESVEELLRVAHEVRIFPLIDLSGVKSPYMDNTITHLTKRDIQYEIKTAPYEFQKGANEVLIIKKY